MEGLAAFGTAVNVLTLIDMAFKTISRIREYADRASDIPESLRSTQLCLPLLADFYNRAKEQGLYDKKGLRDVLVEFNERLEAIEKEVIRIIPLSTDTRRRRWGKALISLQAESPYSKSGEGYYEVRAETNSEDRWLRIYDYGPRQGLDTEAG